VKTFLDNAPPTNKRLRRWYCYLSQFQLRILHIPGLKKESTEFLSRNALNEKINHDSDQLAKETFARMEKTFGFDNAKFGHIKNKVGHQI